MIKSSVWKDITKKEKKASKKGIFKVLPQVPGTRESIRADKMRKARAPGLRRSKSGKKYWETRENRSDKPGKRT